MADMRAKFKDVHTAMQWLDKHSGLWAGFTSEQNEDLRERLECAGDAAWMTPGGQWLFASVERESDRDIAHEHDMARLRREQLESEDFSGEE